MLEKTNQNKRHKSSQLDTQGYIFNLDEDVKQLRLSTNHNQSSYHKLTSPSALSKHQSITQQQIYSHQIIRELMIKSRAKTITHQINQINKQTQLYSKPLQTTQQDYTNGNYQSTISKQSTQSSNKVKQIYQKLCYQQTVSQKLTQSLINLKNHRKTRSQSADLNKKQCIQQRRISVCALISRNFKSLNARRSLGFNNKETNQQKLNKQIQKIQKRKSCPINRHKHIISRRPNNHSIINNQIQQASTSDFTLKTNFFLKALRQYTEQNLLIYGDRMEKLQCTKKYMSQQKSSYQDASFIVNQIQNTNIAKKQNNISKRRVIINNEEQLLKKRKKVLQKQRVMLRHLHFLQS